MKKTYDEILEFVDQKYHEIYASLFSINDDILDENLFHYLYTDNYVVLMNVEGDVNVLQGLHSNIFGYDIYGNVKQGIARPQHTLGNYETYNFNESNSVVVYSNRLKVPMRQRIYEMLTEIASLHFYAQNNLRLSQVKAIIEATTATASTMENVLSEILLIPKSYVISKNKEKTLSELNKVDLEVDYTPEKYAQMIMFYHQQILEIFGVNFTPVEKKERLITDEAQANNELLVLVKNKRVRSMERYFKKANTLFGKSFAFEVAEEEEEETEETEESEEEEESNNDD